MKNQMSALCLLLCAGLSLATVTTFTGCAGDRYDRSTGQAKLWRTAPDALAVPMVFEPEPAFFRALDARLSLIDGHQAA